MVITGNGRQEQCNTMPRTSKHKNKHSKQRRVAKNVLRFFSAVLFPSWAPWKHFALKCRRCIALRSCAVKRRNHCHSEAVILLSCVFKFLRGPIFHMLAAGLSLSVHQTNNLYKPYQKRWTRDVEHLDACTYVR